MSASRREILALCSRCLLTLPFGTLAACRGSSPRSQPPPKNTGSLPAVASPRLPPPLAIPANAPLWIHLQNPLQTLAWLPGASRNNRLDLRAVLHKLMSETNAQRLAAAVDPQGLWQWMILDSRTEVLRFAIHENRLAAVQQLLSTFNPVGSFGARQLPPPDLDPSRGTPQNPGYLAWTGPHERELILAPHERALVTALYFPKASGATDLQIDAETLPSARKAQLASQSRALSLPDPLHADIKKVEATGDDRILRSKVEFRPAKANPLSSLPVAAGALTDLLDLPDFVWGISTRYTDARKDLRHLFRQVERQVDSLPFFVQGAAQNLRRQFQRSLQHWNARVLVGLDAGQHLRAAFGVDQWQQSENDALTFLRELSANLQLIRNFSNKVPSLRLRKNAAQFQGHRLHTLSLGRSGLRLPAGIHSLFASDRRLHLAFCWSPQHSALLLQAGPQALTQLQRWLGALSQQRPSLPPADRSQPDWVALRSALDTTTLESLARQGASASLETLLRLNHAGAQAERFVTIQQEQAHRLNIQAHRPQL